ncbi:MAG TPA: hypothetical protein PLS98_02920 [Dictyoglomaceae bacterium]|nr:hypothetical protein [Dictyoglomaceae bacterium]
MKSIKILIIFFLLLFVSLNLNDTFSWGGVIHSEIVKDAYYYMEHVSYATAQQRSAANWMTQNWGFPDNRPWDIIASGAVDFDKLPNLCFDNDELWPFHRHMTRPEGSWIPDWIIHMFANGTNYSAYMHFLDYPSYVNNWQDSSHGNRRGGIHNNIDGYNYIRHKTLVNNAHDDDYWVDVWMGNDDFCITHSGALLDWYEKSEGGKDETGNLISSTNYSCYTRWENDHHNMIYAPMDNLSDYWFKQSQDWWSHPYWGPFYLGYCLHGVGDLSEIHHVFNTLAWGHSEFEDWANYWYTYRGEKEYEGRKRWFDVEKVKNALNNTFTVGGIPPYKREVRWLLEKLAQKVYNYSTANWNNLWGAEPSKTTFYIPYDDYMREIYPVAVACCVAIMERGYYLHYSVSPNPPVMVVVKRYTLVDETNPEWAGKDDVYAKFVITDGVRTQSTRVPSSGDWGMNEGDIRDGINVIVFETPNVGNYLSINIRVYDADTGDDDLIGVGSLFLTSGQNWGKNRTYDIVCNGGGPGEAQMDVRIEIK